MSLFAILNIKVKKMILNGIGYSLDFLEIDAANRTPGGSPTAEAREKYGLKHGPNKSKVPIWDRRSAQNALKLLNTVKPPLSVQDRQNRERRTKQFLR